MFGNLSFISSQNEKKTVDLLLQTIFYAFGATFFLKQLCKKYNPKPDAPILEANSDQGLHYSLLSSVPGKLFQKIQRLLIYYGRLFRKYISICS